MGLTLMVKEYETYTVEDVAALNRAKAIELAQTEYDHLIRMFKAISDETRLRILWLLEHERLCVGDIAIAMKMTKSTVSHQLKYLKTAEIVKSTKSGKNVYYEIEDDCIRDIIRLALQHIRHDHNHHHATE